MRICFMICLLALTSACGNPVVQLPGEVVEVEIVVPQDQIVIRDWQMAGRVAAEDGVIWTSRPVTSQKPTREEIENLKRVEDSNARFREYVNMPDVLLRAQERSVRELERILLQVPKGEFDLFREFPKLNGEAGPDLKLTLTPRTSIVSRKQGKYASTMEETGMVISLFLSGTVPQRFESRFEVSELASGRVVRAGDIDLKLAKAQGQLQIPHLDLIARAVWVNVARTPSQ